MIEQSQPTISVIIPVYNAQHTIKRCIEAALVSDDASVEWIVVNDGSKDASRDVVLTFQPRVQLLDIKAGPRGPAYARNRGAEVARGDILLFVDADVVLSAGAVQRVLKTFIERPGLAAVFGSYDDNPPAPGIVSRYRNLLHHFVHQNGNPQASTFWAGCGAIRNEVFRTVGGFDEKRFLRASIEDIELGYRLNRTGYSILLDRDLQGSHLKSWKFASLLKADILCRAAPWSRLILESKQLPNDLNLKWRERACFVLTALACLIVPFALVLPLCILGSVTMLLTVGFLNRGLYSFFFRRGGVFFTAACVLLHLLYYLYSGLTYLCVWADFQLKRVQPALLVSKFVQSTSR